MFNKGSGHVETPLKNGLYGLLYASISLYVLLRAPYASVRGNTEGFLVFPPIVGSNPSGSVKEYIC